MKDIRPAETPRGWFASHASVTVFSTVALSLFLIWYFTDFSKSVGDNHAAVDLASTIDGLDIEEAVQEASGPSARTDVKREEVRDDRANSSMTVMGRLVDQGGAPITDGQVGVIALFSGKESRRPSFFATLQGGPSGDLPVWTSSVDAKGLGQVYVPSRPTRAFLIGRAQGKGVAIRPIHIQDHSSELNAGDLVLMTGGSVKVQVYDQDAHPVSDALVAASMVGSTPKDHLRDQVLVTDQDGNCDFQFLVAGQYRLTAQSPGLSCSADLTVEVLPGQSKDVQIALTKEGIISGIVLEASARPAAKVLVVLYDSMHGTPYGLPFDLIDHEPESVLTDSTGGFSFSGIRAGRSFRVRAERNKDYGVTSEDVRVGAVLTLKFQGKHQVQGRIIVDVNEPAPGALLHFYSIEKGPSLRGRSLIEADAAGEFVTHLLPGRYGLVVRHPFGEFVFPQEILVGGETELGDLRLQTGGNLEVSLISEINGEPILNARIQENVEPPDLDDISGEASGHVEAIWENTRQKYYEFNLKKALTVGRPRPTMISPGRYQLQGLATGRHRFLVRASGFAPIELEAEIVKGETIHVSLELVDGAELVLHLVKADGTFAKRLEVELYKERDSSGPSTSFRKNTSSDGRVEFSDLSPGKYGVREGWVMYGFDSGSELGFIHVEPGKNEAEMVVKDQFQLHVSVSDTNGPVPGTVVTVFSDSEKKAQVLLGGSQSATTDSNGFVVLPSLRGGQYTVVAQPAGGLVNEQVIDLAIQGQECEFHLNGQGISGRVNGAPEACTVLLTELPPSGARDTWFSVESGLPQYLRDQMYPVRQATTLCDATGFFEFNNLPAGDYSLKAEATGFSQNERVVVSLSSESHQDVNLTLSPAGMVELAIFGMPRNSPNAFVARIRVSGDSYDSQRLFISGNRNYEFRDGPLGSSVLSISSLANGEEKTLAEFPLYIVEGETVQVKWDASAVGSGR